MKVLEDTPAVSMLGNLFDEKNQTWKKSDSDTQRTSFPSRFQACQRVLPPVIIQLQGHLQDRKGMVLHLLQARLLHRRQRQMTIRLEKERIELKMILLRSLCQFSLWMMDRENPLSAVNSIKSQSTNPSKKFQRTKETMKEQNTHCLPTQVAQVLKSWSDCKNSG